MHQFEVGIALPKIIHRQLETTFTKGADGTKEPLVVPAVLLLRQFDTHLTGLAAASPVKCVSN